MAVFIYYYSPIHSHSYTNDASYHTYRHNDIINCRLIEADVEIFVIQLNVLQRQKATHGGSWQEDRRSQGSNHRTSD